MIKLTATTAALKLQRERGYLVIGLCPGETVAIGLRLHLFAGDVVLGYELRVLVETNRADWDAQVAILGVRDRNRRLFGQSFYRCDLVPAQAETEESHDAV